MLFSTADSYLHFRYKKEYLMFNDDIQGTAATVLAGLYGAMKVQGLSPEHLTKQKIVVAGAGSAGSTITAKKMTFWIDFDIYHCRQWRHFDH